MRVLILGGAGMLGHKLFQVLAPRFETYATFRAPRGAWERFPIYVNCSPEHMLGGVDALHFDSIVRAFALARPDVVINCIGIIKQRPEAYDHALSIAVNALLPHRLADLCAASGARLIHISTDCVFSGRHGGYRETDQPDAEDLYGRSKLLGEIDRPDCLTIRTSIIGRDFVSNYGLLEWFLGHRGGAVQGYTNVMYSGLTTQALAAITADLIQQHANLSGLYQIASMPISKYDLLKQIRDAFGLPINVMPSATPRLDRTMSAARFLDATRYQLPTWDAMIAALADDPTPYDAWRSEYETT